MTAVRPVWVIMERCDVLDYMILRRFTTFRVGGTLVNGVTMNVAGVSRQVLRKGERFVVIRTRKHGFDIAHIV